MKSKLCLWRGGGTLILAAGLALGSAPVVSAAGAEVDLDVVTKVVTAYQDLLDSHWTDSNCSLSSCVNASSSVFASSGDKKSQRGSSFGGSSKKGRDERKDSGENPKFTQAESALLQVRDAMKDFGLPIKTAKSTIKVTDAKMNADGKVTVSVAVGTTKTYGDGDGEPSYMVDSHTLTLSPNPENLFAVVEDTIDPIPANDTPGERPTDVEFNEVPLDRILGRESNGGNHPVADATGAEFSLLPAHKEQESVGMQTVANEEKHSRPDVKKMIGYALHWTSPAVNPDPNVDVMEEQFPRFDVNCTNFASQVLLAGGWKPRDSKKIGLTDRVRDPDAWSPNAIPLVQKATHTWSAAQNLYGYAKKHSSYYDLPQGEQAQSSDLIFVDWDPDGKADGELDHTMIVTGMVPLKREKKGTPFTSFATPAISQKTKNRHNIPLYESVEIARTHGKKLDKIKWYALTSRPQ